MSFTANSGDKSTHICITRCMFIKGTIRADAVAEGDVDVEVPDHGAILFLFVVVDFYELHVLGWLEAFFEEGFGLIEEFCAEADVDAGV